MTDFLWDLQWNNGLLWERERESVCVCVGGGHQTNVHTLWRDNEGVDRCLSNTITDFGAAILVCLVALFKEDDREFNKGRCHGLHLPKPLSC